MALALWFADVPEASHPDGIRSRDAAASHAVQREPRVHDIADEVLFARVRAGDDEALALLYRRHAPSLLRVASSVVRSVDVAADVVQTVFVRILERRQEGAVPERVGAYLHRAVYNAARDAVRDGHREAHRRARSADSASLVAAPPIDRTVTDQELTEAVRAAIAALPGRAGEIFRLWWSGELSYTQIAELTGISVKGVERARARAIAQLRDALRGFWP